MVVCVSICPHKDLPLCLCFMRQIRGCGDLGMKPERLKLEEISQKIKGLNWSKVVVCEGTNDYREPRICFCFIKQSRECLDREQMKRLEINSEQAMEQIKALVW